MCPTQNTALLLQRSRLRMVNGMEQHVQECDLFLFKGTKKSCSVRRISSRSGSASLSVNLKRPLMRFRCISAFCIASILLQVILYKVAEMKALFAISFDFASEDFRFEDILSWKVPKTSCPDWSDPMVRTTKPESTGQFTHSLSLRSARMRMVS